ncbi:hypothetical protein [Natronorubrum texcoconense]|uniref:Uncharacterized protein n=1 Tax=Natronorubrum texcoconense TaxID=1095776 RepID=A0A1G9EPT5_9EURY|nr:hypothetical protein [Natronorubrum texcoconense]SDK78192.1 hypothetical protein SAMN04515672_3927 [Natronorubrum texcoconense]
MASNNSHRMSRRKALSAITAGSVLMLSTPVKGTPSNRPDTGTGKVYREGTRASPICADAISDLQADEFNRINDDDLVDDKLLAVPSKADMHDIVSYAHYIDNDGVMHSHFGYALSDSFSPREDLRYEPIEDTEVAEYNTELSQEEILSEVPASEIELPRSDVSERRNSTKDFLENSSGMTATKSSERDTFSTQSSGFDTDNLDHRRYVQDDFGDCPIGFVNTEHEVMRGTGDHNDRWAIGTTQSIIPGTNEGCVDDWQNDELGIRHEWMKART